MAALLDWLKTTGELHLASAAVLALIFIATALVPIPRTFLLLGTGVIYGPAVLPIVMPSTTIGSIIGFLLSRYLFAGLVRRRVESRPALRLLFDAVDGEGWRIVALCRFCSPIPTMVQNYVFGITRIGVLPFTVATFLFTIPQAALYLYLGATGRAALLDDTASPLSRALMLLGAASGLAIVILVARKVRLVSRQPKAAERLAADG